MEAQKQFEQKFLNALKEVVPPSTNKPTITKEWLANKVLENPCKVIGRALVAIHRNQTDAEQINLTTTKQNGIGFCKPDARVGSIGARMYNSKGKLDSWVIRIWLQPAKDGFPRICKYTNQLQAIAQAKKEQLQKSDVPNLNVVML